MTYSVEYFNRRVLDEIESWPVAILADYARLVELLIEFGPVLKTRGPEGIGRAVYCFLVGQRVVVLHAFVKKTRATPKSDLAVARRRMKEVSDAQG